MKSLHRPDLFGWSEFNAPRNLDFHSVLWVRPEGGNIAFDPLPLSEHDAAHVDQLGGIRWVLITNADHVRAAAAVRARWGATVIVPAEEGETKEVQELGPDDTFAADEVLPCGVRCVPMRGSKTPGEVAFLLPPGDTLVTGDLVRAFSAGALHRVKDPMIKDRAAAQMSVRALAELPGVQAVLVGDGWPVFRDGQARLRELADNF